MKLSVVTTIYKSAGSIVPFYDRAREAAAAMKMELEVIFVNDGSPDEGLAIAQSLSDRNNNIIVVDLSRNFGQARALWTGLQQSSGDFVAMLDGDMEEDPLWLAAFYETMTKTGCEVVFGVQAEPKGTVAYKTGRNFFYRLMNLLSAADFPRNSATARLMSRRYVRALLSHEESEIALFSLMHIVGFSQHGVLVEKFSTSPTTYTPRKLLWLFITGITSFSIAPLIYIFISGLTIFFCSGFFIFCLLLLNVSVPGWLSVMAAVSFFSGLSILFQGIIAIYIGTIFLEVKKRPVSIIRSISGSSNNE